MSNPYSLPGRPSDAGPEPHPPDAPEPMDWQDHTFEVEDELRRARRAESHALRLAHFALATNHLESAKALLEATQSGATHAPGEE